jgi:hypothetical protein
MRYRWLALAALAAGPRMAVGQDPYAEPDFFTVTTYDISLPIGDTRRFLGSPSWAGLTWEGRWPLANRSATAGFMLGLNEFSERFNGTTNFPSGAASGPQFRYLLSMSVMATGYVYTFGTQRYRWYFGGGAGAVRVDQVYELGVQQVSRAAWHAVAAPEVGAEVFGIGGLFVGVFGIRFNAPLSAGNYVGGGARSFQSITFRVGLSER